MRRTIEIVASFTGKISTGEFENSSPMFSLKEILEFESPTDAGLTDDEILRRQKTLHEYCYKQFNEYKEKTQ